MNLFSPPRRFDPAAPEQIDRGGHDPVRLRAELRALELLNRRLGSYHLTLSYLEQLPASAPASPLRILDLGTGAADLPRAIAGWARQRQFPVEITAVDRDPEILQIASESCEGWPEIRFERHDLLRLPYPSQSFDIVLCGLVLHHFSAEDAVTLLRRMQGLARVAYLVNDLRRNFLSIALTDLLAASMIRAPMIRQDARASCRAAFTVNELRELAHRAGLTNFQIDRHHAMFRMVLFGRK